MQLICMYADGKVSLLCAYVYSLFSLKKIGKPTSFKVFYFFGGIGIPIPVYLKLVSVVFQLHNVTKYLFL